MNNTPNRNINDLLEGKEFPVPRFVRPYLMRLRGVSWLLSKLNQHHYNVVNASSLREKKRSDTVFIFGSGNSLNYLRQQEWDFFAQHDTFSFNFFLYQDFIRADFHLLRETHFVFDMKKFDEILRFLCDLLKGNKHYQDTIFLLQGEWAGFCSTRLIGKQFFPKQGSVFWYQTKSKGRYERPSNSFDKGLVHGPSTLCDTINAAYILGWKNVVLVGVDLYDYRYFWLGEDEFDRSQEDRGKKIDDQHQSVNNGIINYLGKWHDVFKAEGRSLSVYNPKSLLADVMPIYQSPVNKL